MRPATTPTSNSARRPLPTVGDAPAEALAEQHLQRFGDGAQAEEQQAQPAEHLEQSADHAARLARRRAARRPHPRSRSRPRSAPLNSPRDAEAHEAAEAGHARAEPAAPGDVGPAVARLERHLAQVIGDRPSRRARSGTSCDAAARRSAPLPAIPCRRPRTRARSRRRWAPARPRAPSARVRARPTRSTTRDRYSAPTRARSATLK